MDSVSHVSDLVFLLTLVARKLKVKFITQPEQIWVLTLFVTSSFPSFHFFRTYSL